MEDLYKFVENRYIVWEYADSCPFIPVQSKEVCENEGPVPVMEVRVKPTERWDLKDDGMYHGEGCYVKNYGNLLATVNHSRITIVVGRKDDKVSIKIFQYIRIRNRGRRFFKVTTKVDYVSYNLKTHSLYSGHISNYHKKRKFSKAVRQNCYELNPLNMVSSMIRNLLTTSFHSEPEKIAERTEVVDNVFKVFFKNIPGSEKYKNLDNTQCLYAVSCENRGIKLPNNWNVFSYVHPQPKMKDLRKHQMKYMDALMTIFKLKGDKIKKVLHSLDTFNHLELYRWCEKFFGESFMLGQSDEFLKKVFQSNHGVNYNFDFSKFSKSEKKNVFCIFQQMLDGHINANTFFDHLSMKSKISIFEDIKWKSKNYLQFRDEHMEFTERLDFYTKGEYKRTYPKKFVEKIQENILGEYYPVLLTDSLSYNLESFNQSNCVKGYVNKESSLIISLRKGNSESKERATIEYNISKYYHSVVIKRVQTLGRFNYPLTSDWNEVVQLLDERVNDLVNDGVFDGIYECEYKVGYTAAKTKTIFEDSKWTPPHEKILKWENPDFGKISVNFRVGNILVPEIEPMEIIPIEF